MQLRRRKISEIAVGVLLEITEKMWTAKTPPHNLLLLLGKEAKGLSRSLLFLFLSLK